MKITQDLRDYAKSQGITPADAAERGMHEKAEDFRQRGGEIYLDTTR